MVLVTEKLTPSHISEPTWILKEFSSSLQRVSSQRSQKPISQLLMFKCSRKYKSTSQSLQSNNKRWSQMWRRAFEGQRYRLIMRTNLWQGLRERKVYRSLRKDPLITGRKSRGWRWVSGSRGRIRILMRRRKYRWSNWEISARSLCNKRCHPMSKPNNHRVCWVQ